MDEPARSAAALIAASQELNGIEVTARDLTHGRRDRSALVSATAAIGHYNLSFSDASAESRQHIEEAVAASRDRRKQWQPVVEHLAVVDPGDPLTRRLSAYVEDGGLDSLRQLIEAHVHDHGVRIKREQLIDHDRAARSAVRRLHAALVDIPADQARTRLTEVVTQVQGALRHLQKQTDEIESPTAVDLPEGGKLLDAVHQSAVIEVFRWREWTSLVAAVRDENRVMRSVPPSQRPKSKFSLTAQFSYITETDGLVEQFGKSVDKLTEAWRGRMLDWAETWAAQVRDHPEVAQARRTLLADDANDLFRGVLDVAYRQAAGGISADDVLSNLGALVRFDWIRDAMEDGLIESQWCADDASARCPLLPGRALPWHHDVPDDPDGRINRHQTQIFRLRRELALAVSDVVTARVSRLLYDCVAAVRVSLEDIAASVPEVGDLMWAVSQAAAAPSLPGSDRGRAALGDLLDQWGEL
jgi:hypothetical protein